jgi:hypothetical protein
MFLSEQPTFRARVRPFRLALEAICAALVLGSLAAWVA